MSFGVPVGRATRYKFYLYSVMSVLRHGLVSRPHGLSFKQLSFYAVVLSKARNKKEMNKHLSAPETKPILGHLAKHIFLISQKARCKLDVVGDDLEISIQRSGIEYRFRFLIVGNKAPFIHTLVPLADIFFLGLYDRYDYRKGTVIDIGGFIGDTAVYFAKNGAKVVLSYEPNPVNYEYLLTNLKLNGVFDSVRAFNLAVSMEKRKLSVPGMSGAGTVYAKEDFGTTFEVQNITPNEVFREIETVDLLKVDCKGCERELFGSALYQVRAKVRNIIIDNEKLDDEERKEMISRLVRAGFVMDDEEGAFFHNGSLS